MKEFTEEMRYEYDLSPGCLVMDVGAHKGTFANEISRRYHCNIWCYEPIAEFFKQTNERFKNADDIICFQYGLGREPREDTFKIKGDMTGKFADQGPEEIIRIMSIADELDAAPPMVNLIKINIEGGEYELLETILDLGLTKRFRDIQVQFHACVPDAIARREAIRQRLALTHELTYDCAFIWENWRLKA